MSPSSMVRTSLATIHLQDDDHCSIVRRTRNLAVRIEYLHYERHQLLGEQDLAREDAANVADALLQWPVAGEMRAHVRQDEFLHAGRLRHLGRAGRATLADILAILVHDTLI